MSKWLCRAVLVLVVVAASAFARDASYPYHGPVSERDDADFAVNQVKFGGRKECVDVTSSFQADATALEWKLIAKDEAERAALQAAIGDFKIARGMAETKKEKRFFYHPVYSNTSSREVHMSVWLWVPTKGAWEKNPSSDHTKPGHYWRLSSITYYLTDQLGGESGARIKIAAKFTE